MKQLKAIQNQYRRMRHLPPKGAGRIRVLQEEGEWQLEPAERVLERQGWECADCERPLDLGSRIHFVEMGGFADLRIDAALCEWCFESQDDDDEEDDGF